MRKIISRKFLILGLIILLGAFLRFFKLVEYPIQLNHDEVSQLYDAISIAQTGRDIYGNFLPFVFPSVGDFKPPFYTYITSLFYFIFGGGELIIRLPAAIFGLLMIPAVYFFVSKFLNNSTIALFATFFTSLAPFEIFFSRKSFENGVGIFFILLGFSCLFMHFKKQKLIWAYATSVFFAIAMYTYFSHTIIIPFLIIAFVFIFRKLFLKDLRKYLRVVSVFIILILPLFLLILINPSIRNRSEAVFIKQDVNLGRQLQYLESNFLDNFVIFDYSFNRYLKQFDPIYLFGNGLDLTNQGPLGSGPFLLIQLPFLLLGIIYLFKQANLTKQGQFILVWVLLGVLPSGLTFESFSPHRVVMVFTMLNIVCAIGAYFLIQLKNKNARILILAFLFFAAGFFINFVYFVHIYTINFPYEKSQNLHYPFKQVAQFAWLHYDEFDQIVFDPLYGEVAPVIGTGAHYYFAYFGQYSPDKFQQEFRKGSKERETVFDKFSIRKIDWREDQYLKNVLIIGSPWSLPLDDVDQNLISKKFNFYNGRLAFYAISP